MPTRRRLRIMPPPEIRRVSSRRIHAILVVLVGLAFSLPAAGASFIVNSDGDAPDAIPGDGFCYTGFNPVGIGPECTFRAVIEEANAFAGADVVRFSANIPMVGDKVILNPETGYPAITGSLMIDGYTAPGYDMADPDAEPVVTIYGGGAPFLLWGLLISNGDDSLIRGLALYGFSGNSIRIGPSLVGLVGPSNVTIQGCHFGVRNDASSPGNGGSGIEVVHSDHATIGRACGSRACSGKGNLISGNGGRGILIASSNHTEVYGNRIGVHRNGISIETPNGSSTGNVGWGIEIMRSWGGGPVPNSSQIGSTVSGSENVIAGNGAGGIHVDSGTHSIVGNHVGLDASDQHALGNTGDGVLLESTGSDVRHNRIGTNSAVGIRIVGNSSLVASNLIGTNSVGADLGNGSAGIRISGDFNQIGEAGAGNVVGFNSAGINTEPGGNGNVIQANFIGTDSKGRELPNGQGIRIGSSGNLIGAAGGLENGLGNAVGFNVLGGIYLGITSLFNSVHGNFVGTNTAGEDLGNGEFGIEIRGDSNVIGGEAGLSAIAAVSFANVIGHNLGAGVRNATSAVQNSIRANELFANESPTGIDLGPEGPTTNDVGDVDLGSNRLQNSPEFVVPQTLWNTDSGELEVRYRVNSNEADSAYPLDIDFYLRTAYDSEADVFLGSDVYPAASATINRSVGIVPIAEGEIAGVLVATATDADGNTSELSREWVPVPEPAMISMLFTGILFIAARSGPRRAIL